MAPALTAALGRHRLFTAIALIGLVALAWGWLIAGAGMPMEPLVSLAPPRADPPAGMAMGMGMEPAPAATGFAVRFAMWWAMMVAMMLPAAAPTILLYMRSAAHSAAVRPFGASFLAGYLLIWGLFSLLAAALQAALESVGLVAPMTMAAAAPWLSAAILVAAGAYQLSPLKDACLSHCRNPASFLARSFRPGRIGALRMGAIHGAYCVGCCWMLMGLLFVGGVMNLAWIALLTLVVAAEKLLPFGRAIGLAGGLALLGWGLAIACGQIAG